MNRTVFGLRALLALVLLAVASPLLHGVEIGSLRQTRPEVQAPPPSAAPQPAALATLRNQSGGAITIEISEDGQTWTAFQIPLNAAIPVSVRSWVRLFTDAQPKPHERRYQIQASGTYVIYWNAEARVWDIGQARG